MYVVPMPPPKYLFSQAPVRSHTCKGIERQGIRSVFIISNRRISN